MFSFIGHVETVFWFDSDFFCKNKLFSTQMIVQYLLISCPFFIFIAPHQFRPERSDETPTVNPSWCVCLLRWHTVPECLVNASCSVLIGCGHQADCQHPVKCDLCETKTDDQCGLYLSFLRRSVCLLKKRCSAADISDV